jgi:hypothetical protein
MNSKTNSIANVRRTRTMTTMYLEIPKLSIGDRVIDQHGNAGVVTWIADDRPACNVRLDGQDRDTGYAHTSLRRCG